MYQPRATYRIQFHKDFTFSHLEDILPYLHTLGIKTIYASPVFAAVPGSAHGYDGTDPNLINPEIGTLEQLKSISRKLRELGMGWIQDFVPNHMAYDPSQNAWLEDVLEKGRMSPYDNYFDKHPDEPLMAPFLGAPLERVLENNELSVVFSKDKLRFRYFESAYPLNYPGYKEILGHFLLSHFGNSQDRYASLSEDLHKLSAISDKDRFQAAWKKFLQDLKGLLETDEGAASFAKTLADINGNPGFLRSLSDTQFYRLCYWKETNSRVNYRRFFTINGLICLNMQDPVVFHHYHRLLTALIKENIIQGVRVDHIDGLYDPAGYLRQLRKLLGDDAYITIEKILELKELLPGDWPVEGTTGYDFLGLVNQVLTNKEAEDDLTAFYENLSGKSNDVERQIQHAKSEISSASMKGEWNNLVSLFFSLPGLELPETIKEGDIRDVIAAVLIFLPVYRYYPDQIPLSGNDLRTMSGLIEKIKKEDQVSPPVLDFFLACFTRPPAITGGDHNEKRLHFLRRCMQLSGPLMAKGVEDTLMYRNYRFLAHNEVGDSLRHFAISIDSFHEAMIRRQQNYPLTLNATATHDTKRGEDARARLRALSICSTEWINNVRSWMKTAKKKAGSLSLPDQYFVIQAVYASLPSTAQSREDFEQRISGYLKKAAREGKLHSGWDNPDMNYENDLVGYALAVADVSGKTGKGIRKFLAEQEEVVIAHSLMQLVLKCTCPGVPDIYQGTEFPDLSFVDPDNRRPVNYAEREISLDKIAREELSKDPLHRKGTDGNRKLFTLYRLLSLRKAHPDLFAKGQYIPLPVPDPHCLVFARRYGSEWAIIMISLQGRELPEKEKVMISLPPEAPLRWKNIFTGDIRVTETSAIPALFTGIPVAVFVSVPDDNKRSAGILMPLFSLPSLFGIGGLGREAYGFADFLAQSGQKAWQILPVNPVLRSKNYSPYASASAFAGEPLYIDPGKLISCGLLTASDLKKGKLPAGSTVNYELSLDRKVPFLRKAWQNFNTGNFTRLQHAFNVFCKKERAWLDTYAFYVIARKEHAGKPWYEWPSGLKMREAAALGAFEKDHFKEIEEQKWLQFIFFRQWFELKHYCEQLNIRLIGDLPFYMDADSADVWANRSLFNIDEEGKITYAAGVPPDYFSETGQLWDMPTYNWDRLEHEQYYWWMQRLRKNTEMYHLVRLDHFRAFYDYWEIPGGAETAVKGTWRKGPQEKLFNRIAKDFPAMPFIAEDLGEVHQLIFDFRDRYGLPGMRVLQFGFEHYDATLRDLPHNFSVHSIAYTGTHDNNTILGWFRSLDQKSKEMLSHYLGYKINQRNVGKAFITMVYRSVSEMVILPVQDILGLDKSARINTPSTTEDNWKWRLLPGKLPVNVARRLLNWTRMFNR